MKDEIERIEAAELSYAADMHPMQSGVAWMMNYDSSQTDPKHLRVGVNSALIDSAALAWVLIQKGVISEVEYKETLAKFAAQEKQSYIDMLQKMHPSTKIDLG